MLLRKVRDIGDWNHIEEQIAKESTFPKVKESKSTQDLENGEKRGKKAAKSTNGEWKVTGKSGAWPMFIC